MTIQGQSIIYRSTYLKTLGFVVDETLGWEDHINRVIRKTSSGLAVLRIEKIYFQLSFKCVSTEHLLRRDLGMVRSSGEIVARPC